MMYRMKIALRISSVAKPSFRTPDMTDGVALHQLAVDSQGLDVNSEYAYLLPGMHHADTSVMAEVDGSPAGFITGYPIPNQPGSPEERLFIWQVAVHPSFRRQGLARAMLKSLLARPANAHVRFIETTITPSNKASNQLFEWLTRELDTGMEPISTLAPHLFPSSHEAETLFRIGPFNPLILNSGASND